MIKIANGPIDKYLRLTGKTDATFDVALKSGDAAATSVFAAEAVYSAIQDLIQTIENSASVGDEAR